MVLADVLTPLLALSGAYLYVRLQQQKVDVARLRIFEQSRIARMFRGRMGRWAYLCAGVALLLLYIVCIFASVIVVGMASRAFGANRGGIGLFVFAILTIFFMLLSYSLTVRRLHDLDLTGWLGLTYYLSYIGPLFGVFVLLWPGTKGSNRYGEAHDVFSLSYVFTGRDR